ncbi:MAG: hypothetical protein KJ601_03645 [Nanoarchaeota archaeon]|nr:hypothetical protein [Nanoarchaeota archaeon]MBU1704901.1 hypothetical protein [Nanoarchaeota archaeon]
MDSYHIRDGIVMLNPDGLQCSKSRFVANAAVFRMEDYLAQGKPCYVIAASKDDSRIVPVRATYILNSQPGPQNIKWQYETLIRMLAEQQAKSVELGGIFYCELSHLAAKLQKEGIEAAINEAITDRALDLIEHGTVDVHS